MLLLIRTVVAGLIGGCLVLALGFHPRIVILKQIVSPPRVGARHVRTPPGATLIDVASSVSPEDIASLIKLERGERIASVDDARVGSDLAAGAAIADRAHGHDSFVDLAVIGPSGPRRVLLLVH
jgi:hypothetical protein